jgi:hypothetical protein
MIIYKSAGNCVVELELLNDSVTNLERNNIVNKNYAEYKCNKAKGVDIYNKFTEEKVISVNNDIDDFSTYGGIKSKHNRG